MFKLSQSNNSPNNPPHLVNFDLGSDSHADTAGFNPLQQFDHIGKKKLDQVCQEAFTVFSSQFILIANHVLIIYY